MLNGPLECPNMLGSLANHAQVPRRDDHEIVIMSTNKAITVPKVGQQLMQSI